MRKSMVIINILLVLFFLFIINNTSAGADEKIISKISISIKKMDDNLKSPFAKAGLEMTVWNFYKARVAHSINRYEMNKEFQQGFMQSFLIFKKRLWAGNFQNLKSKIDNSYLEAMEKSYKQNKAKYLGFKKSLNEMSYFPPNYSLNLITESQAYFSLILFDVQKNEWVKAKKFTYIFPFCD